MMAGRATGKAHKGCCFHVARCTAKHCPSPTSLLRIPISQTRLACWAWRCCCWRAALRHHPARKQVGSCRAPSRCQRSSPRPWSWREQHQAHPSRCRRARRCRQGGLQHLQLQPMQQLPSVLPTTTMALCMALLTDPCCHALPAGGLFEARHCPGLRLWLRDQLWRPGK